MCGSYLLPWWGDHQGDVESSGIEVAEDSELRRVYALGDLIVSVFLVVAFGDEELLTIGIFKSLHPLYIILVHSQQPHPLHYHLSLSQTVELAY